MEQAEQAVKSTRERAVRSARRQAIDDMEAGGTHTYYTEEFAESVQRAFGMPVHMQAQRANTNNPKGLFVDGVGQGVRVKGYASHDLAEAIARHLGLHGVWEQMMGRGSRQWAALEAIGKYLTEQGE